MRPIYDTWRTSKERLQQSSSTSLKEFNQRRNSSPYYLDGVSGAICIYLYSGTTEALVIQGFIEDLFPVRAPISNRPFRLINISRDQEAAIQLVMYLIAGCGLYEKPIQTNQYVIIIYIKIQLSLLISSVTGLRFPC